MHKSVLNCSLTPSQGKYSFDPVSKVLAWEVGKIDQTKLPNLRGSVNLVTGAAPEDTNPSIRFALSSSSSPSPHLTSLQPPVLHQPAGCEWAQGEQAGHVWGEVQTIQGGQVSHQGWQVPSQNVVFCFINISGIFSVICIYCDWCWVHLY